MGIAANWISLSFLSPEQTVGHLDFWKSLHCKQINSWFTPLWAKNLFRLQMNDWLHPREGLSPMHNVQCYVGLMHLWFSSKHILLLKRAGKIQPCVHKGETPLYPKLRKARGSRGTVRFSLGIWAQGTISKLSLYHLSSLANPITGLELCQCVLDTKMLYFVMAFLNNQQCQMAFWG